MFEKIGYKFKNYDLLIKAFRHASYVNEQPEAELEDNERLEFLGDAVLDLAISDFLMERFKNDEEGVLSKYRAVLVDESGLYRIARRIDLGKFLHLGKGEEQSKGRKKPSILANTMEALMGALYLDAGFDVTREIIGRLFAPMLEKVDTMDMEHDFKSLLQEHTQRILKTLPKYSLVEETGPAHDKTFRVELELNGEIISQAEGKSKKEAEQKAAREAFFCLKED
ncbi:ribonuclease III [Thermodesulfobacteriota bacterium]